MSGARALWLPLLVSFLGCGGTVRPPETPGVSDVDDSVLSREGEVCPGTTSTRYVLYYDARTGEIFPQQDDTFPVGGQQVSLCVIHSDWRDIYRVGTTDEIALDSGSRGPAFEVGPPVPQTFEANERVAESQAVSLERRCGGRGIARTVALLEHLRSTLLTKIQSTFEGRVTPNEVAGLRAFLQELRSPRDSLGWCARRPEEAAEETTGQEPPGPVDPEDIDPEDGETAARCSLEQYINFYALPDWLWLVSGQIYLDVDALRRAGCGAAVGGVGRTAVRPGDSLVPESIRPLLVTLLRAMAKASALVEFSESLLQELTPPQRIFELGGFDDNRLVSIRVSRFRRIIEFENGVLRSAWQQRNTSRRQEIHALTYFRVEPGFIFSTLRRPEYSIGPNTIGDQVIRMQDDGLRVFHPGVMLSFYWCGTDLRYSPFRRVCHAHQDSFLGTLLPLLPTLSIGIPIDDSLVSGTGSLFIGGLLNWFPYVSIGVGYHVGLNVSTLRDEFRVGDPVAFDAGDLNAITQRSVQAGPYISLTIANDAFEALSGFEAAR